MPLCGDVQQDVVTDTVITLGAWIRAHREFVLGTNEAGMRLLGSTRAADAAIWRRSDLGNYRGGLRRVPPVLTIEVAGADEAEDLLREKALWYLNAGIEAVWVVLPEPRAVLVITASGEARFHLGDQLPPIPSLPGLTPQVGDFFTQLSA
ncbi:MAG: Uma2 family endonuclease [Deltaproteobacteria bacterium]|nr:Uma2 family endonuclease [Deltaproteobacteria bacterium]MBI3389160.1 Uma2 family endonuclease [Deltaproteobacteria bacterium]